MNIQTKQKLTRFPEFYEEANSGFAPADVLSSAATARKPKFLSGQRLWFALIVVLPTLITAVYFTLFAADQYLSKAEFVVRTQEKKMPTGLSSLMAAAGGGGGSTRSEDDTYAVQDYIMSRDAVGLLQQNDQLRQIFNRSEADPLARFPRIPGDDSFEELYKAYPRFVDVTYDSTSGMSTLKVTAFRPDDAHRVAAALLSYSEQLVNRLSARAEKDAMSLARGEVAAAEQRASDAQLKIKDFRNREVMLDPAQSGKGLFELVAKLAENTALAKAQLLQLQKSSPNSPQIGVLKDQIAGLESQIDTERAKMAGNASSMAPKVTEYEQLELEKQFAYQDLESAHQLLQTARLQAEQQHLYLETIVQPNTSDYALYPRRLRIIATVFGVSLLLYGLGWLVVAGAKEHVH